jgi:superfamily II DNA/RNA helicase
MSGKKENISFEAAGVHSTVCAALAEMGMIQTYELQQKTLLHTVNDFADIIAEAPCHSGRHTLMCVFAAHCILAGDQPPKRNVFMVANSAATSSKIVSIFHHLLAPTKIPVFPCLEERPPKAASNSYPAPGGVFVGTLATFAKWSADHFTSAITLIVEDCFLHDEKQLHATIESMISVAPTTNLFFLSSAPPSEISISIRYLFRRTNRRYYFSESEQPHFSYLMCHDADDRNALNERIATMKGFKNILILTHNREVRELKAHLHQHLGVKTFSIQRNTTAQDHDRVLSEFLRSQYAVLVAMDAYTGVDLMDLDAVIQFYPPQKSMPEEEWADFVSFLQTTSDPRRPTTIVTLVAPDDFSLVSYFMRRVNAEGPVLNVSPNHPQFHAAVLNPQAVALEKMRLENGAMPPLVSPAAAVVLPQNNSKGSGGQQQQQLQVQQQQKQQQQQQNNCNNSKRTSPVGSGRDNNHHSSGGGGGGGAFESNVPLPRSQRTVTAADEKNVVPQQQQSRSGVDLSVANKQSQQQQQQQKNKNGGSSKGGGGNGGSGNNNNKQQQQQQQQKQQQQQQQGNKAKQGGGGGAAAASLSSGGGSAAPAAAAAAFNSNASSHNNNSHSADGSAAANSSSEGNKKKRR